MPPFPSTIYYASNGHFSDKIGSYNALSLLYHLDIIVNHLTIFVNKKTI